MGKERVYQGPLHEGMKFRLNDGLSIHTINNRLLEDQAYLRGHRVSLIPPNIGDRAGWDQFTFVGKSFQRFNQELEVGAVYSFNTGKGTKAVIQVLEKMGADSGMHYTVKTLSDGPLSFEDTWTLYSKVWISFCVLLFSAEEMGVVASPPQTTVVRSSEELSIYDPRIIWPVLLARDGSGEPIRSPHSPRHKGDITPSRVLAWRQGCYDVTLQETAGDVTARDTYRSAQRVVCRNSAITAYPPGDAEQDRKIAALTWGKAQTGRAPGIDGERRVPNIGKIRDIYRSGAGDDIDGLPNREVWRR